MTEDHLGVANGASTDLAGPKRLQELLDEEVLPRLERPSRLIGPFGPDGIGAEPTDATRLALVWPSLQEEPRTPAPFEDLLQAVPPRRRRGVELLFPPSPDLERELGRHALPPFTRPGWVSARDFPFWLAWLESPLQLLGLLTLLEGCGRPCRSTERGEPYVLVAGPAVSLAEELVRSVADLALLVSDPKPVGRLLERWLENPGVPWKSLAAGQGISVGEPLAAPHMCDVAAESRAHAEGALHTEAPEPALSSQHGLILDADLQLPTRTRRVDAITGAVHDRVRPWAASAALRERLGLPSGAELGQLFDELFAQDAGTLELDFAIGLPGESAEDRLAIAPFLHAVLERAPRGARQVHARVGHYVGRDEGSVAGPEETQAWLKALAGAVETSPLGLALPPIGLAWIAHLLRAGGTAALPVMERMHRARVRSAESPLATDAHLWHKSMSEEQFHVSGCSAVSCAAVGGSGGGAAHDRAPETIRPAECGLPRWQPRTAGSDDVAAKDVSTGSGRTGRSRGSALRYKKSSRAARRADRWTRWQALTPRQFDYRVEFAKTGRLRFLSQRDFTALLLDISERVGLPLATAGVVQPRPKIGFGPSLPVGIEGCREYVDLGLTRKVPQLAELLRRQLPPGLELHEVRFVPTIGQRLALSNVARAVYEAQIAPRMWREAGHKAQAAERIEELRQAMSPGGPDGSGPLPRLVDIQGFEEIDGSDCMRFVLDLANPGVKCKPRDLLSRLLEDLVVDVRCIPLRRTHLLAVDPEESHQRLLTPMEQVRIAERRGRVLAKQRA